MATSRLFVLWISGAALIVGLGSSFAEKRAQPDRPADQVKADAQAQPAATASQEGESNVCPAPRAAAPTSASSVASTEELSSPSGDELACPPNHSWTCCPCGGCGCRPQWMSPANWCACS